MFLQLEVNGKKGMFLLDTGAGVSIVDINQSERFEFKYFEGTNFGQLDGIGGARRLVTVGNIDLSHEGRGLRDLKLYGADIQSVNNYFMKNNMRILGILGSDFLKKQGAIIDYGNAMIFLDHPYAKSPSAKVIPRRHPKDLEIGQPYPQE